MSTSVSSKVVQDITSIHQATIKFKQSWSYNTNPLFKQQLTIQRKNQIQTPLCEYLVYSLTLKLMFLAVGFNQGKELGHKTDTDIFSGLT